MQVSETKICIFTTN